MDDLGDVPIEQVDELVNGNKKVSVDEMTSPQYSATHVGQDQHVQSTRSEPGLVRKFFSKLHLFDKKPDERTDFPSPPQQPSEHTVWDFDELALEESALSKQQSVSAPATPMIERRSSDAAIERITGSPFFGDLHRFLHRNEKTDVQSTVETGNSPQDFSHGPVAHAHGTGNKTAKVWSRVFHPGGNSMTAYSTDAYDNPQRPGTGHSIFEIQQGVEAPNRSGSKDNEAVKRSPSRPGTLQGAAAP
eukprot:GILJ01013673.1.p1 GENE.GILJ01013673.1~~GILJ01013673.1.p1  ORF type:complete len:246 (-),score=38.17 GILJ01013673.1:131-868(-)